MVDTESSSYNETDPRLLPHFKRISFSNLNFSIDITSNEKDTTLIDLANMSFNLFAQLVEYEKKSNGEVRHD